ncbi:hypothetical protein QWZ08_18825 [Ferruginibacter paludis]|uniref:hypothetical protein n=1 Tax=Ferruginibacter paludis TaxID=1310417 RepID=UPI0025B3B56A|nr:hypothetical protein [Ferruginibacter paludis]MDN3657714.1 hypothetical protein [Ferruginibacter paludis]
MKSIMKIDFRISSCLIIFFTIVTLLKTERPIVDLNFLTGYFVVGGWQVISMIVHALNHWFTYNKGKRYAYHWITFISIVTMPLGSVVILVFTAPFMAIWYTWICYEEVYIKMQRPLALLK